MRIERWLPVLCIFALALLVRILYNNTVALNYVPTHDAANYQQIAFNLLQSGCFCLRPPQPLVDRAPIWPVTIAIIYGIFGPHNYIVRIFLSLLGAGSCVLIYLFVRDIFSTGPAILAGALAAVYPQLYVYDSWLNSESFFIFLLVAFCYALLRMQRTQQRRWMIVCGLLLALLSLERPNGLFVVAIFLLWALIAGWTKMFPWRQIARCSGLVTLVAFICIVPWTIRNFALTGTLIPVAAEQGSLLIGIYNNAEVTQGSWANPDLASSTLGHRYHLADWEAPTVQVARENEFTQFALNWIWHHKRELPSMMVMHFLNLWEGPLPTEMDFPPSQSTNLVLFVADHDLLFVYTLAALGLLLTFRQRWRELLFLYLTILMIVGQSVVFYGSPRLRSPLEPLFLVLIAGVFWWVSQKLRPAHKKLPAQEQAPATPSDNTTLSPLS